jgi:hypothetical protein
LFHRGRPSRDISLNAKYLVVFKIVRDKNQFAYLPDKCIPKTATVCSRDSSTPREGHTVTYCSNSHKTRMMVLDSEPIYFPRKSRWCTLLYKNDAVDTVERNDRQQMCSLFKKAHPYDVWVKLQLLQDPQLGQARKSCPIPLPLHGEV